MTAKRRETVDICPETGLARLSDAGEGVRRRRRGRGFAYIAPDGALIRDKATLERIAALAIPPAWTEVWIAPRADAHIQATGRDGKGRKQYRYHDAFRAHREVSKFGRLAAFARALGRLRARRDADLGRRLLTRANVLAAMVAIMERTHIRIGSEAYARENDSYGLTILRQHHVEVSGARIRLVFPGKSGKDWDVTLRDRRLARIVAACCGLEADTVFCWLDGDEARPLTAADVNDYLRAAAGADFTARTFRTWAGTVLAFRELAHRPKAETATAAKRTLAEVVKAVAARLGNTPAVCRKSYIHPAVLESIETGEARRALSAARGAADAYESGVARLLRKA